MTAAESAKIAELDLRIAKIASYLEDPLKLAKVLSDLLKERAEAAPSVRIATAYRLMSVVTFQLEGPHEGEQS